jgi:apolipoprotein N-acyltransferase
VLPWSLVLGVWNFLTKMIRISRVLWPWLAAILSGLLCIDCFPPLNQGWFCWFSLIPLVVAIWFSGENSKRRWLRNLLLGYVAGIVFFTGAFSWLGSLGTLYESFWLHGLSLLLSLYLAVYFAFWAWFVGLIRPPHFLSSWRNLLAGCLAASAWVAHEWIRGWMFTGFGWNGLGVALHANWPLIQIAEFTGVAGLSFLIVLINVIAITTACRLFLEARQHRMRPHYDLTLTMASVVGVLAYGVHAVQNPAPAKSLHVAAVQANVPQREKFDPQFTHRIFDKFTRLSQIALRANPPPDLLIWPESSMPAPVLENEETYRFVMNFCASDKTDLLLGTIDMEPGHEYNAAVLFSDQGRRVQVYHKLHLVPFGEYIPLRHSFPLFAAVAGNLVPGDFDAGKDFTVFRLTNGDVQVAPLICFEDTLGEVTRQFVLRGANLLADVTNDGWFLHSAGSQQHLANAIFRCVETRRPMVRAANTGVTCFVNQFGHVIQILHDETGDTFTEGVLSGSVDVPLRRELTFYTRHGELFAKICAAVTALAVLFAFVRRKPL